jgi:hypothetical protein
MTSAVGIPVWPVGFAGRDLAVEGVCTTEIGWTRVSLIWRHPASAWPVEYRAFMR